MISATFFRYESGHPDELPGLRVWLALTEIAGSAGREDLTEIVDHVREREREVMTRTDPDLPALLTARPSDVPLVEATVDGLRRALVRGSDPMTIDDARASLASLLGLLAEVPRHLAPHPSLTGA